MKPLVLALVLLAAAVAARVVPGASPDALAAGPPRARAAQALTIGDLRVQRRAPGGRVRASVAAAPGGARLQVVVRRSSRRVARLALVASSGRRTAFTVRLDSVSRARLQRVGHLDLRIDVTASAPGTTVSTGTTARVSR